MRLYSRELVLDVRHTHLAAMVHPAGLAVDPPELKRSQHLKLSPGDFLAGFLHLSDDGVDLLLAPRLARHTTVGRAFSVPHGLPSVEPPDFRFSQEAFH